jgi:hypothetical protein
MMADCLLLWLAGCLLLFCLVGIDTKSDWQVQ